MENDMTSQLFRKLYKKFGFIAENKTEFEKIIYHGSKDIKSEKDLYQHAKKNISEYIIKTVEKDNKLIEYIKKAICSNKPQEIFDYFNGLFEECGYKPDDEELAYMAGEEYFKKYFDDLIKNHKTEALNQNFSFIKNNLLASVIEIYALTYIEEEVNLDSSLTDDSLEDYVKQIKKIDLLSIKEEHDYAVAYANGDMDAREELIVHNLRLVVKIAKKYIGKYHDLSLADLIDEGNIGLIKAVDKFDATKGFKLSTYATWWIEQSIQTGITASGRSIKIPAYKIDEVNKVRSAEKEYVQKHEKEPSIADLSEMTGLSHEKVKEIKNIMQPPISLDKKAMGDESEDTDLYNFLIVDENEEEIDERYAAIERSIVLPEALKILNDRDRTIIIHRFGLYGNTEKTLEEVGKILGVTRERVRQLEPVILDKLERFITNYKSIDNSHYQYKRINKTNESCGITGPKLSENERNPKLLQKAENIRNKVNSTNHNVEVTAFDQNVTRVELTCKTCNYIWINYTSKLSSTFECPNCKQKSKDEKYTKQVNELNSDLTISSVINTNKEITVHCNRCGDEWRSRIHHLLNRGCKCRQCASDNKQFVQEMETIADNYKKYEAYVPDYSYNPYETYLKNKNKPLCNKKLHEEVTKDDVQLIAKNLSKKLYKDLADNLTVNDILILLIDKGYACGNKYSDEAICKLLNISLEELYERRKNIVSFNKQYFEKEPYVRKRNYKRKNIDKGE